jgi:uncharacterized membrane protein
MHAIVKWLYLAALIVWLGEIVFFSFVVAPAIFRTLPTADAGRAVGAVFPLYYRLGYVCGGALLLTTLVLMGGAVSRAWWGVNAVLAALMLGATLYAGVVIQPRVSELRPQIHDPAAPPTAKEEFDRLHRLAVQLNGAVLLCGVVVSIITARALRP